MQGMRRKEVSHRRMNSFGKQQHDLPIRDRDGRRGLSDRCAQRQIRPTYPQSCALKRPCSALAVRRANCA